MPGASPSLTPDGRWPNEGNGSNANCGPRRTNSPTTPACAGTLRIGTDPTVGASLLPQAVIAFRDAHPDVRLTVRSARIAGLWTMLENREIEMSLMWDYDWSRIDREDIVVTPLLDDPPALLVSDHHPLAGRDAASLADFAHDPWITRADHHPVAEALVRGCRSAGFDPHIAYEAHDYQEAQAMVAAGIGVALAPPWPWRASAPASPSCPSSRRPPSAASSWCAWPTTRSPPPP